MGFRRQDLQEAFFVPGTHGFRVWGYGTTDTLEEVLRPNYLRGGQSLVHPGELIYVCTRPRREPADGRENGETRVALVMVSGFERGDASLRLVQDFDRPEDGGRGTAGDWPGAVAAAAPKRKRGRGGGAQTQARPSAREQVEAEGGVRGRRESERHGAARRTALRLRSPRVPSHTSRSSAGGRMPRG